MCVCRRGMQIVSMCGEDRRTALAAVRCGLALMRKVAFGHERKPQDTAGQKAEAQPRQKPQRSSLLTSQAADTHGGGTAETNQRRCRGSDAPQLKGKHWYTHCKPMLKLKALDTLGAHTVFDFF